ncbi:MAG TPA: (d)CMP kinase [Candidatus Dormibacteraeota bacterium]|jgi:cytidylate kinase|nr:(d)CMP kinase [Candidatus Dormibacteraeota bacterium]
MVIAIDGPAGSGKTTIGRILAEELGFAVVDTGLFYRAVTVEARRRGIAPTDVSALTRMLGGLSIIVETSPSLESERPLLSVDARDITREAFAPAIATDLAQISQLPEIRRLLLEPQRQAAKGDAVVLGRDIGTVVFPDADVKFFFTAPAAERLARRRRELDRVRGSATPDALLQQEIEGRDRADEQREIAPLRPASDAIIVATEGKSVHQVFDEVMARLPKH